MSTTSTGSASAATALSSLTAGLSSTPANQQIDQTGFLKIITAQLTDQNPLSPSDPTQFVTQLEGMSEVSSLQSLQSSTKASSIMNGSSLIGHSVLVPGTTANLATGGSVAGAVTAPAGTTALTVNVADSTGATVDSFKVTPATSGLTSFTWSGATNTGATAAAGTYTLSVTADVNGTATPVNPNVVNKVDSVLLDPSTNAVDIETDTGSTVPLSSIVAVM